MDDKIKKVNKLIAEIAKNNIDALDGLFEEVGGLLYNMAKKYLVDKSLAEDLVSEIFVRLAKRAHSFDAKRNGLNWLYKSIHNEAINWNKKSKASTTVAETGYNLADMLVADDGRIDSITLRDALGTLSKKENEILYYKFWEGLTVREIAARAAIPRSTVQDIIDKALAKLQKLIQ